jgi:uncharacterized tellurite resistance protein B-like protein
MFEFLKKVFTQETENQKKKSENGKEAYNIALALCTFFVEIAKADDDFSGQEKEKIISIFKKSYNIDEDKTSELISDVEEIIKKDDSIYEYTTLINKKFTNEQKFELVKDLWRLTYVDQNVDAYEEHLVKKIGGLINLDHRDIIGAKLMIKEELN